MLAQVVQVLRAEQVAHTPEQSWQEFPLSNWLLAQQLNVDVGKHFVLHVKQLLPLQLDSLPAVGQVTHAVPLRYRPVPQQSVVPEQVRQAPVLSHVAQPVGHV